MNIKQVAELLSLEGEKIIYRTNEIKEYVILDESYLQLVNQGGQWVFEEILKERRTVPEFKPLARFTTENQASKLFLLNQLSSYYFSNYVITFKTRNNFSSINDSLDIASLRDVMKEIGIPSKYLSYEDKKRNSIYVQEMNGGWHISYIDNNGNVYATSIAFARKSECISMAFNDIYKLFLLDAFIQKNSPKDDTIIEFNNNEIGYYLDYKTLDEISMEN